MTVGLDTSVVLRLLTGEPAPQADAARRLFESGDGRAAVSDLVVGESYFALRYHYKVPRTEAVRQLLALLEDPRILATGTAAATLRQMLTSRSPVGVMDRLIHADFQRDGFDTVTFDRDFAHLAGVRLVKE